MYYFFGNVFETPNAKFKPKLARAIVNSQRGSKWVNRPDSNLLPLEQRFFDGLCAGWKRPVGFSLF